MVFVELMPQTPLGYTVAALAISTAYATSLVIYRLCLSPLASVPGPKLAAASGWYEFYYDCLLAGKFIFEIERMHKVYGKQMHPRLCRHL